MSEETQTKTETETKKTHEEPLNNRYRQDDENGNRIQNNWAIIILAILIVCGSIWWVIPNLRNELGKTEDSTTNAAQAAVAADFEAKLKEASDANKKAFDEYRAQVEAQRKLDADAAQTAIATAKAESDRLAALAEQARIEQARRVEIETIRAEARAEVEAMKAEMTAKAEAEAKLVEKKGTRSFEITPENLPANWLGFDEKVKPGYKIPMMRNNSGRPTPFHPDFSAPVETDVKGNWVVINDFKLLNGETVSAWAVKLK